MSIIQGCHETTPLCETTNVIQRISPEYSPSSSLYHPLVDSIPKGKKNSQTDTWIISHFIPNLVWGCSGYVKAMFDASINCCTSHLSMIKSLLFIVESPAFIRFFGFPRDVSCGGFSKWWIPSRHQAGFNMKLFIHDLDDDWGYLDDKTETIGNLQMWGIFYDYPPVN